MLIVGTGNGLDALGVIEIFDPRSVTVTDLTEASLSVARENILAHIRGETEIELRFYAGDLLATVPEPARFCLVYENLPNIPAGAEARLELGTISGRFFDASAVDVPRVVSSHLLALHHRCLEEARPRLRDGGGVLTAIGGRMPPEVAFGMHRACGYRPELLAFDVKLQSEPGLVLPGYRQAEEETGVGFRFYAGEAVEIVGAARRSGLDGQELADTVEDDLGRLAISTSEALARAGRGEPVAHSVLMIYGGTTVPANR